MLADFLHPFSLCPKSKLLSQFFASNYKSDFTAVFRIFYVFCATGLIFDLARMTWRIRNGEKFSQPLSLTISCAIMLAYYTGTWLCGRWSIKVQNGLLIFSALLYSLLITESHVLTEEKDDLIGRILSSVPFFVILLSQIMVNFVYSSLPFTVSLLYPVLRLLGIG
eukprot:TRINITY_DN6795_c0_g2_i7.p1 TRINITY_DN6795_c0_g2~~TRINITY_DN6795_c0_g2_i7.p1  ORF type:complete len:166 (-),score=5.90 TRINITY_DN6795_c0_g2_i7:140-637(-)